MKRFTWLRAFSLALAAAALMVLGAQVGWADELPGMEVVVDEPEPAPPPPAPADDEDRISFYLTGIAGGSFVEGQSGGFNTTGNFENASNDYDEQVFGGGALGVAYDVGPIVLRMDIEGEAGRGEHSLETDSSVPGTPDYHYQTDIEIPWTVLGNVWIDFPLRYHFPDCAILRNLTPFVGAGFGASSIELSTNDTIVRGGEEETDFSWQIGGGLSYAVTEWLTLETRYRLLEIGEVDADLENTGALGYPEGAPAGNYELNLRAHEVLAGIRFTFFSF